MTHGWIWVYRPHLMSSTLWNSHSKPKTGYLNIWFAIETSEYWWPFIWVKICPKLMINYAEQKKIDRKWSMDLPVFVSFASVHRRSTKISFRSQHLLTRTPMCTLAMDNRMNKHKSTKVANDKYCLKYILLKL